VTPDSLCYYFNLRVPSATQLHQVRERFDVVRYRIGGRPPVAVQQQEPTTCTMRFRALNLSAEVVACWANEFLMESKQSACPAPAQNAIGNTAWTLTTEAYRILLDELHHTKPNWRGTEADTETAGPCCIWKLFSCALALEISLRDQARANVMHACIPCLGRLAVRVNDRSTNSHRTDRP